MSDSSFKTKYRSRTFDEYIGNDMLKTTILNRFATGEPFPTSLMVFGQSGCGKTTIGRLIVKQVLCKNKVSKSILNRVYKVPCNVCDDCKECDSYIQTGIDDDLIAVKELDATKTRKVDDVDAFIAEAKVPFMYDMTRVYLIDECHMLTRDSQNALLKLIEDPPSDTIFIFCTTDPHKVIETLWNRMDLTVEVLKPSLEDNIKLLTHVCEQEGISYERAGLALIAERSNYTYRASLTSLENVYRSRGTVYYDDAESVYSLLPTEEYFSFFKYLVDGNIVLFTSLINKVEHGIGCKKFIEGLRDFVKRGFYIANGVVVEGVIESDLGKYKRLFKSFSMDESVALLDFLNRADEGDLETKLLLLGYRGLDGLVVSPSAVSSSSSSDSLLSSVAVSTDDVKNESRAIKEHVDSIASDYYKVTSDKANLGLVELDPKSVIDLF